MPKFADYTIARLDLSLKKIKEHIYSEVAQLEITAWWSPEPVPYAEKNSGKQKKLKIGDKWGNLFDSAWFNFQGTVPPEAAGKKVVLLLDVNGELCVFDKNGSPIRGLTNISSAFDDRLGGPGKRVLQFCQRAKGGEKIDIWADAGCNDLFGILKEEGRLKQACIAVCDERVRSLYYDFEVLLDLLKTLSKETARYQQVLAALNKTAHLFGNDSLGKVEQCRGILARELKKRNGDVSLNVSAIGHAHLDLAWLWPVRESIRKAARTFSTAIELMDRYPDYIFGASQPQQYLWMKEVYPELYKKIKAKVSQGKIEPLGASWVEFDTNISGGEAIIRQLLFGKKFFKQEFDADVDFLWQPDVFGYTGSLPQILAKTGVKYFMTQKLSWSLINVFPHHSFLWQGIDGSAILTHMLPEETYNSQACPFSLNKIEKNYRDKDVSEYSLLVFGIGDGGGGPGAEHLERLSRMKNLAGLPPTKQVRVKEFFAKWRQNADQFQKWIGELYLERHQGTFTTNARNKWYNRKIELALRELEWASILDQIYNHGQYPAEQLEKIWQEVLLYQFHDILPGSSIKRVYDESVARYQKMLKKTTSLTGEKYRALANKINTSVFKKPVVVFNSLSWQRNEWQKIDGQWQQVDIPSLGYKVIENETVSASFPKMIAQTDRLENDIFKIKFHTDGSIFSIYDKQAKREILKKGEPANKPAVYLDEGDAWDFPLDYAETEPRYLKLSSADAAVDGPTATVKQIYQLGHSELLQEIALVLGSRRIEFNNKLKWREIRSMLRTSFPVDILTDEATYEIQFGNIKRSTHRNTSWDLARDEVPAQKWADLSQRDYGVALMNDSKYGYKIKDNILDLNLLRSVPYPNSNLTAGKKVKAGEPNHAYTDQFEHVFRYALYPHPGDFVAGNVARAAYEFNVPLSVFKSKSQSGELSSELSFLEIDSPAIFVESAKKAESGKDIILRLFEAYKGSVTTTLKTAFKIKKAEAVNLMEEATRNLKINSNNTVTLRFRPFEIKTVKLTFV